MKCDIKLVSQIFDGDRANSMFIQWDYQNKKNIKKVFCIEKVLT